MKFVGNGALAVPFCDFFLKATPHKACAEDAQTDFFVRLYRNSAGILSYVKGFLCKMTENMSADSVQSRQVGFVRCCLKLWNGEGAVPYRFITKRAHTVRPATICYLLSDNYLDAFLYLPGVMPTDDMNWRRKYLLSTYPHLSAISAIFMGVAVR